jgi:hypothetical protein
MVVGSVALAVVLATAHVLHTRDLVQQPQQAAETVAMHRIPHPHLLVSADVDTSRADVRAVLHLWWSALRAESDSTREQTFWAPADLAGTVSPDLTLQAAPRARGFLQWLQPTVLHVARVPGTVPGYVLVTAFSVPNPEPGTSPLHSVVRVHATRDGGRWVLANALRVESAHWPRVTRGPFTFVTAPGLTLDLARADSAVTYTDSLRDALDLPAVAPHMYYVVPDAPALLRLEGVEWAPPELARGGEYFPDRHVLLVSRTAGGEFQRHELTHAVVAVLTHWDGAPLMLTEGLAVWQGGGYGSLSAAGAAAALEQFWFLHPRVTPSRLIRDASEEWRWQAIQLGAALCARVHERHGPVGIRLLIAASTSKASYEAAIERLLGVGSEGFDALARAVVHDVRLQGPGVVVPHAPADAAGHPEESARVR